MGMLIQLAPLTLPHCQKVHNDQKPQKVYNILYTFKLLKGFCKSKYRKGEKFWNYAIERTISQNSYLVIFFFENQRTITSTFDTWPVSRISLTNTTTVIFLVTGRILPPPAPIFTTRNPQATYSYTSIVHRTVKEELSLCKLTLTVNDPKGPISLMLRACRCYTHCNRRMTSIHNRILGVT